MNFFGRNKTKQVETTNTAIDPAIAAFTQEWIRTLLTGNSKAKNLEVTAVLRSVDLLSSSLAMLPMRPVNADTRQVEKNHPLYDLLMYEPNPHMTAFEFKRLMERRRMSDGVAYAQIIRVGSKPVALYPLEKSRVFVEQRSDWSLKYTVTRKGKSSVEVPACDIFHLRDILDDEVTSFSRMKLAQRAIQTASDAENAQRNIFKNGALAKGMLSPEGELSDKAFARLKADIDNFSGPDGAGRFMLGENNMSYTDFGMSGRDAQTQEARAHSIEEIARIFGIPRPLLMMDDTSWGSGIEQLATLFVMFGLAASLKAWEQSARRCLLTSGEKRTMDIDIDESLLLRGSLKDRAEFFAKASGSGGHAPWMHPDEIRHDSGKPPLTEEQKKDMQRPEPPASVAPKKKEEEEVEDA